MSGCKSPDTEVGSFPSSRCCLSNAEYCWRVSSSSFDRFSKLAGSDLFSRTNSCRIDRSKIIRSSSSSRATNSARHNFLIASSRSIIPPARQISAEAEMGPAIPVPTTNPFSPAAACCCAPRPAPADREPRACADPALRRVAFCRIGARHGVGRPPPFAGALVDDPPTEELGRRTHSPTISWPGSLGVKWL